MAVTLPENPSTKTVTLAALVADSILVGQVPLEDALNALMSTALALALELGMDEDDFLVYMYRLAEATMRPEAEKAKQWYAPRKVAL